MDISIIDGSKVTPKNGLIIGNNEASIKIVEFMNVRCPFCKKWFDESFDLLNKYVKTGQLQRVIKLYDKEKESLKPGNIMHRYIDYNSPEKALSDLQKIYATQNSWGNLSLEDVATFAETQLNLTKKVNEVIIQSVLTEANAANIQFVPTCIIGKHIFDESITLEKLTEYIENY
ncbi:DsbA family protein [Enterococcus rivorum]|uniref:Thioredoxin n=1 Tax=Enterococcus rivorum TaxID=762845 RepID=A0A1E5KZV6_9ENTE|nr:DsbA family protein [Enterococcus rivorum]MBP2099221.1 protein-disulfide isomerase [Enterococcus rivorum]OEH83400.1 thioredoxin [Enterococcus rivorum]